MITSKQKSHDEVYSAIQEHYSRLLRYSLVLTGDRATADDLVQASCVKALEKSEFFESGTHADRWLFKITQRLWISELRKAAVRKGDGLFNIDEVELVDQNANPEMSSINKDVLLGVVKLPEAQRSAVLLVYVEGYSYEEAANILEIPIGTVMSRLSVARKVLSKRFSDHSEASS